ncbi:MAG: Verru_Chthon cassette protein B [Verrucomicrobiales bacterium]
MKIDQTPPSSKGFTLIEVTLAIAITAIALVGLMGLLPQGLKTLEAAGERAIEARIHQDILSEIMLTSWEKGKGGTPIDLLDGEIRRYDDQGIQLTDADNDKAIFTAKINILKKGSQLPVSVGGGASAGVNIPGMPSSRPICALSSSKLPPSPIPRLILGIRHSSKASRPSAVSSPRWARTTPNNPRNGRLSL